LNLYQLIHQEAEGLNEYVLLKEEKKKHLPGEIYDFCRQMVIKIYSLSTCIIVEKKMQNPTLGFGTSHKDLVLV
jgi:hypothetical protein